MASFQELDLLERRIKRFALQCFVVSGFSLLVGLGLLIGGVVALSQRQTQSAASMGVMGVLALVGAWAQLEIGREHWPPRSSRLYREVASNDASIAWAHLVVGSTSGVRIHFNDGKLMTLPADRKDSEALMALIQRCAPGALLGYGPEQQRLFRERSKARGAQARS